MCHGTESRQHFRARFTKQGDIRFISHHDLMRVLERALRRARLPVAMSQGFNPRPRISVPSPLGVGVAGDSEVFDFELSAWERPDDVGKRLQDELPQGLTLTSLRTLPCRQERRVQDQSYRVALLPGHGLKQADIDNVLGARELVVERVKGRATKKVDIRPFLGHIRLLGDTLHVLVTCLPHGTARPDEVLAALGLKAGTDYLPSAVVRTNVSLSSSL